MVLGWFELGVGGMGPGGRVVVVKSEKRAMSWYLNVASSAWVANICTYLILTADCGGFKCGDECERRCN